MSTKASSNRLEYEDLAPKCEACFWSYQGSNSLDGWKLMCAHTPDSVTTHRLDICQGKLWEPK